MVFLGRRRKGKRKASWCDVMAGEAAVADEGEACWGALNVCGRVAV
jgi:hypothetical protein